MKALKGKMPRILPNHRTGPARQIREVYNEIAERFALNDGVARRVAVLAAKAWLDYLAVGEELAKIPAPKSTRGGKALAMIARMRRRQAAHVGQYLAGLRALAVMTNAPEKAFNLLDELARQGNGEE